MFCTKINYVNKTFAFKFFHAVKPTFKFNLPVYYTVYVSEVLEHVTIQRHIWEVSDPFKAPRIGPQRLRFLDGFLRPSKRTADIYQ
jgi:hypothetical protein